MNSTGAVVGLKSKLVMQGESTGARANAIAFDQLLIGRPRTLDELHDEVEAVTLDSLNAFLASHKPQQFSALTIGPKPLAVPGGAA
jgi:predicted Zn-dependent peptidase